MSTVPGPTADCTDNPRFTCLAMAKSHFYFKCSLVDAIHVERTCKHDIKRVDFAWAGRVFQCRWISIVAYY